jgi:hypothetical protein
LILAGRPGDYCSLGELGGHVGGSYRPEITRTDPSRARIELGGRALEAVAAFTTAVKERL